MKLDKVVKVNALYTRAVQLERDQGSGSFSSYLPTARALKTLSRISETFDNRDQPRAWSIVGPYGSGKSSLALFSAALCGKDNLTAVKKLATHSKELANRFKNFDCLPVLITGSPEPLSKRLVTTLLSAIREDGRRNAGAKKSLLKELMNLAEMNDLKPSLVIEAFEKVIVYQRARKSDGLFLVIDELGKFLEFEARNYGANDIFLLQGLAELSLRGGGANLYVMVLLHRSIDQYANGLGESLKQEWSKIQGRFEEIPFIESPEQILRVVAAAFEHTTSKAEKEQIRVQIDKPASALLKHLKLETDLSVDLFQKCYPLHPLTALLLPHLCNKVSQNERTLFSFLGSEEEYGFKEALKRLSLGEMIYPWDIYDYFVANQVGAVGDHLTHRRWIEVVTAVERASTGKSAELNLLKCIGLFNIIASKGYLKASSEVLSVAFPRRILNQALDSLTAQSLVVHRKFNNEYRVWQGSDFDIDGAIQQSISALGDYSIAEELNKSSLYSPIVARKHSIDVGALRFFLPMFVDAHKTKLADEQSIDPRIFFFLAFGHRDEKVFKDMRSRNSSDIFVYCESPLQLRDAVLESVALSKIQIDASDLSHDPIASREFSERIRASQMLEKEVLGRLTTDHQANRWYFQGKKLKFDQARGLQRILSQVLDQLYPHTPIFKNELINRDRPSAQAVSARTKLMEAMLLESSLDDLGIEKFPAEKSMYRALLKETGVHRKVRSEYKFSRPPKINEKLNAVWDELDRYIVGTEIEAKSLVELNSILLASPYGIKAGVLPVLYLAYYLANEHELAVFESRRYCPILTPEMLERFVKRPDDFTFQLFRIKGLKASLFKQYSVALFGHENAKSILDIARPLAQFMGELPEYTLKTKRGLTQESLSLRNAFNLAKSPEHLIFEKLPEALGFSSFQQDVVDPKELSIFADKLRNCLSDLKNCYGRLLLEEKAILAQSLNQDATESLEEIRNFSKHWYGLEKYTADTRQLGAFLSRLTKTGGDAERWFENILMFLVHKEPRYWTDSDRDEAEFKLHSLTSRALELQKIRFEADKFGHEAEDYDFYLLKTVKKGDVGQELVVPVSSAMNKRIEDTYQEITRRLSSELDIEMQLALLAKLLNDALSAKAQNEKPKLKKVSNDE